MLDVVGLKNGHFHGYANAIVCTQRRAFGLEPLTVYIGLNGIFVKIEFYIFVFFAHHVLMTLKHSGLAILIAGGGWLANQYVASIVYQGF